VFMMDSLAKKTRARTMRFAVLTTSYDLVFAEVMQAGISDE